MRKNKGITLIALIITIVILLILAGISITTLSGENGLFTRAKEAKEKTEIANAMEEINLAIMKEQIRAETGENLGNIFNYENVWNELREKDSNLKIIENTEDSSYIIEYKGYKFKIDKNKVVTYIGKVDNESQEPTTPEQPTEPEATEYTITYNKNDGSGETLNQIVAIGQEITLENNKFTIGGYEIEGWYTNEECTGTKITKVSENIEVYAKWIEKTAIESVGSTTIGSVTYTESYEIWNKAQLSDFRNKVNNGKTFENCILKQKADINLNSETWAPIGDGNNEIPFSGTYDGEERKIEGLYINSTTNYQGLFGYVQNGTVENITVAGSVTGGSGSAGVVGCIDGGTIENTMNKAIVQHAGAYLEEYSQYLYIVGGICAQAKNEAKISNCINEGTISGGSNLQISSSINSLIIGGIVGITEQAQNVQIKNCGNKGNIKIDKLTQMVRIAYAGGIVSCLVDGIIESSYNIGNIESELNLQYISSYSISGGIVGYADKRENETSVNKCWNSGSITNYGTGGIVGISYDLNIEYCYNFGKVISDYNCGGSTEDVPCSGGITGYILLNGTVSNCYNMGEIYNYGVRSDRIHSNIFPGAGGISGFNRGLIEKSYNLGKVEASVAIDNPGCAVGGIEGEARPSANLNNCYNIGTLYGSGNYVVSGGITGWLNETTKTGIYNYIYSIGKFNNTSTNAKIGGLIGYRTTNKAWTNFYWLNENATYVSGNETDSTSGKCTSEQIKTLIISGGLPSTDWATDPNINDGYPYLKAFDDTTIWLRDSTINGGEPYLKDNPPVE